MSETNKNVGRNFLEWNLTSNIALKGLVMKKLLLLLSLVCVASALYAVVYCPPPEWVRTTKFKIPKQNLYDETKWNFLTEWMQYEGELWQIEYGSFFPHVHTVEEALKTGQQAYLHIPPTVPYPEAYATPGYWLCEYTSSGKTYWITALHQRG